MARPIRLVLALAAALALAALPKLAAAQPTQLEIPVLLPLTGPRRRVHRSGASDDARRHRADDERTWRHQGTADQVRDSRYGDEPGGGGAIHQRPSGKKAPLVLGPGFTSECFAVAPLIKNQLIDYCISPAVLPPAGSTIYSAGLDARDYPVLLLRYFVAKHWTRVALISSTDASGQVFDTYFDQAVERSEFKSIQLVSREHFGLADLSVNAQLSRIKAASPHVAIEWTAGTAFATLLRGTQEVGLNVPIAGGTANTTYTQMAQYASFLPNELIFPSTSPSTPGGVGPGPIRAAQKAY